MTNLIDMADARRGKAVMEDSHVTEGSNDVGRSGVGFNVNGDFKIDCGNDQCEQIVKIDSNARFMRNKP
ncbi:hypothetical protein AAHA92_33827 [Salvia divinorum]|uniref:Uncharacterized protein n=1 Tax=Salvia divinorum TaxID=28513 RepID=A0ABD1FI03_SALDI